MYGWGGMQAALLPFSPPPVSLEYLPHCILIFPKLFAQGLILPGFQPSLLEDVSKRTRTGLPSQPR